MFILSSGTVKTGKLSHIYPFSVVMLTLLLILWVPNSMVTAVSMDKHNCKKAGFQQVVCIPCPSPVEA